MKRLKTARYLLPMLGATLTANRDWLIANTAIYHKGDRYQVLGIATDVNYQDDVLVKQIEPNKIHTREYISLQQFNHLFTS